MKFKIYYTVFLFLLGQIVGYAQDQDTKIPFNKGILKICSSKNFKIKGYDGNEVIIKSLSHMTRNGNVHMVTGAKLRGLYKGTGKNYYAIQSGLPIGRTSGSDSVNTNYFRARTLSSYKNIKGTDSINPTSYVRALGFYESENRSKGLQKLGKKGTSQDNGIYLNIEQNENELIIRDLENILLFTVSHDSYEMLIPNTVRLQWNSSECTEKKSFIYTSKSWELTDFRGEAEITSALNNLHLTDVTGPVLINTIGANVTVEFDKTTPKQLYSIYSNNGFIDIKLPEKSSLMIDAKADEIFSDIDFNIEEDEVINNFQQMKLKLNKGRVKMKLDAGLGNIYLRK